MSAARPPVTPTTGTRPGVAGVPPELTQEVRARILGAVASGANRYVAAQSGGVGRSTLGEWLTRGRRGDPFYAEFLEQVKRAEAEAEVGALARINRAAIGGTVLERKSITVTKPDGTSTTTTTEKTAPGQWQASAWYLERKHPGRYGTQRAEIRLLESKLAETLDRLAALTGALPPQRVEPTTPPALTAPQPGLIDATSIGAEPVRFDPAGVPSWAARPHVPPDAPGDQPSNGAGSAELDW